MWRSSNSIIAIAVVLIVLGLLAFLWAINTTKKYHWYETYHTTGSNPYDLNLFYDLLDLASEGERRLVNQPLSTYLDGEEEANYFFVNSDYFDDSASAESLLNFLENGNKAFIATHRIPASLQNALLDRSMGLGENFDMSSENLKCNFYSDDLYTETSYNFNYFTGEEYGFRSWNFNYDYDRPDDDSIRTNLGYGEIMEEEENAYYNFFSLKIGDGELYIHSQPILFTNYYIKQPSGFEYVNKVLSHFDNKPVIWDNFHSNYYETEGGERSRNGSPLKYILANPALRMAWYVLIAGVLLFIFFGSKREQRIIPLIPRVKNTSIEFAKSLGTLYFQAKSGRFIAIEMMRLFDNYNRRHYRIHRKDKDEEIVLKISKKSKVGENLVREILSLQHKIIYNPSSSTRDIIPLYQMLQSYYKKTAK